MVSEPAPCRWLRARADNINIMCCRIDALLNAYSGRPKIFFLGGLQIKFILSFKKYRGHSAILPRSTSACKLSLP